MVCLFFNITRQVAICLFTCGRRFSLHQVDNQYTVKLPCGLPFRTEMSSTVYLRGCGWERDGSACAVRAPLLFVHVPHLLGCVRDRYKPRQMVCAFVSVFCLGGCDFVNVFVGICVDYISNKILNAMCVKWRPIHIIYRGPGDPREDREGS